MNQDSIDVISYLPIDQVRPDPNQPRRWFDDDKLGDLARSIAVDGLIQPIEVRPSSNGHYILVHGERRWRAAKKARLDTIRAIINSDTAVGIGLRIRQFVENSQREDMNIIEEALFYREMLAMVDDDGRPMSKAKLSRRLHVAQATITSRLLWLELPEEIQQMVALGQMPSDRRVAKALLTIPDKDVMRQMAHRIVARRMTVRAIETACGKLVKRLEGQKGNDILSNRAPMLSLGLDGGKPDGTAAVSWKGTRSAARRMCAKCALSDMTGVTEPAWHLVMDTAEATCRVCPAEGNLTICRECPGVTLIRSLITAVNGDKDA